MLYYNFKGVEGFKKKYYANNGKKKIILAYAKSQMAWELAKNNNNYQYLDISDMNAWRRISATGSRSLCAGMYSVTRISCNSQRRETVCLPRL